MMEIDHFILIHNYILFSYFLADTELAPCSVSRLLQFHDRYLAYLIAAREQEMYPDFQVETWAYEDREEIIAVNLIPFSSSVRPSAYQLAVAFLDKTSA